MFSVVAVLVATVALSQQGSTSTSVNTASISSVQSDGSSAGDSSIAPQLRVLVSDPANTAIVQEIAGDLLIVESVVPPGGNGHTYEPVPGDARKAVLADLFIENGMDLNPAVTKFVEANSKADLPVVTLSESIPFNEVISTDSAEDIASHGHAHSYNAHFWTDPIYVIAYAEQIKAALSQLDPANAQTYSERADRFVTRLRALDESFRNAISSIPLANRKLVVYHDSWSYFGRRYEIPVVGAIQPVTFSEPSANEIRRMVDQIRNEQVPAFFGSEVFPSDVLEALAGETGATYYANLSDEELPGEPGSPEHSYEGLMIANVRLIVSALGGDVSTIADLVPGVTPS
jgi:ABC-type Zn uptake system ZnuABC Zn-binding protein ZnuA